MLFSVVIPCYNSKKFLRSCLDSVVNQKFNDFEIIAIDDGSNDGSEEILDEYSANYENFNTYHFLNAGISASRRRGITLASGEYIIFVDSDDSINPELLSSLSKAIKNHNHPDLIRYQVNLVNDSPKKDHERYNFIGNLDTPQTGINALRQWSIPGKKYAVYWLFAFKKDVFANIMFVAALKCYEDVAIIPILVATSKSVVTINYPGYNYVCNNANSLTNTKSYEAQRSRALDFLFACKYAMQNFKNLEEMSISDIIFFFNDYIRRLKGKFNSLPEDLKKELWPDYKPFIE